ncbi:MAG: peptidylprolyl isomerase [Defluviitaleaceae bacterium]|nr:peptidylprolyl isomerase [Defluviitaleaceae bacterium]
MNKYWKKYALAIVVAGISLALVACGGGNNEETEEDLIDEPTQQEQQNEDDNQNEDEDENWQVDDLGAIEVGPGVMLSDIWGSATFEHIPGSLEAQIAPPQAGEEVAIIHTNFGPIHLRLFPELAPLAVENFITHARDGYYDGVIFHRVMEGFMIQGGDPEGTGMGGESIWGMGFGNELSPNLRHIRGALSMANADNPMMGVSMTNSSQFFIVQNNELDPGTVAEMQMILDNQDTPVDGSEYYFRDIWPADALEHYIAHGGTPFLDFAHTVFGQVFIGMEVVDAIAATPTDGDPPVGTSRPLEDVIIERIEILSFGG